MELNCLWCPLRVAANVLGPVAVADYGAINCQVTTKADASHNVELTTKTAIEPNACYALVAVLLAEISIGARFFVLFCGWGKNIFEIVCKYKINTYLRSVVSNEATM